MGNLRLGFDVLELGFEVLGPSPVFLETQPLMKIRLRGFGPQTSKPSPQTSNLGAQSSNLGAQPSNLGDQPSNP